MSQEEYNEALNFMQKSLVNGKGMVGIFWYNRANNTLFGVHKESPFDKSPNCEGGLDYKDKPRGRVFYNPADNRFIVCVGSWIKEYPDAIDTIVDVYGLENENYEFTIQEHWEIGMGYGE